MAIDAGLIIKEAEELFGLLLLARRAEELAAEVTRLNASTAAVAVLLELEDEPLRYLATLRDLAGHRDNGHR